MPKNPMAKTRNQDEPYEVWRNYQTSFIYRVLRSYQTDRHKNFARALCFVTSPYCPQGELGDVYWQDIMTGGVRVYTDPSLTS